jgi:hypothetical protein
MPATNFTRHAEYVFKRHLMVRCTWRNKRNLVRLLKDKRRLTSANMCILASVIRQVERHAWLDRLHAVGIYKFDLAVVPTILPGDR